MALRSQKWAIWRQQCGVGGKFLVHQVLRPPETKTCPFEASASFASHRGRVFYKTKIRFHSLCQAFCRRTPSGWERLNLVCLQDKAIHLGSRCTLPESQSKETILLNKPASPRFALNQRFRQTRTREAIGNRGRVGSFNPESKREKLICWKDPQSTSSRLDHCPLSK